MKSSKILAVIILLVAALWLASSLVVGSKAEETSAQVSEKAERVSVRIRVSREQDYSDNIAVTGRTQASKTVTLRAEVDGRIVELLKEEGDFVRNGELLAKIDARDLTARVNEAKERVDQRVIEYNAAEKLADKGFNSQVRLAQAAADLEAARAALTLAQVNLKNVKIIAPFDGIVSMQDIEVGDYVDAFSGNQLLTLVKLDPIEVSAYVSERRINDLELGQQAKITLLDGQEREGEVIYIAPSADEDTRTFRLIVSAQNPENEIKAGLTAKLYIPLSPKKAHRISPSVLTLDNKGRVGVKIVNDQSRVEFHPVEIISDQSDVMWIHGLPKAVRLITVGQEFVNEGQKVKAVLAKGEGLL